MSPRIIEVEQGTPEWLRARMGMPTASEFATVMATGKEDPLSKTRRKYLLQIAGEIITGEPMENYTNAAMERGKAIEDEARRAYAFMTDAEPKRVGFVVNGPVGCSPDAFIGKDGLLEIKVQMPHLLIERLLGGSFPPEHMAQCQGGLWVCEREFCDIGIYWPKMPLYRKRLRRDEAYIARLKLATEVFIDELNGIVEKIRQYGFEPAVERSSRSRSPAADGAFETKAHLLAAIDKLTTKTDAVKLMQRPDYKATVSGMTKKNHSEVEAAFVAKQATLP